MLNTTKYIAEQKIKAYEKIHIPTKDEVMEDMIAIGKAIAGTLDNPKPLKDVYAVFVENNNRDLEFYGFVGDGAGTIDCEGNLVHIGDTVALTYKGWRVFNQCAIKILPKQKTIYNHDGRVVKSYKEFPAECKKDTNGLFTVVSCLNEYLKSINQSNLDKGNESVI